MSLLPHLASRAPEVRAPTYVAPLRQPGTDAGAVELPDNGQLAAFTSSSFVIHAARAVAHALHNKGLSNKHGHREQTLFPIEHPGHQDTRHHDRAEAASELFKSSALDPLSRPEISYGDGHRYADRSDRFTAPPEGLSAAERLLVNGEISIDSTTAGLADALALVYRETS